MEYLKEELEHILDEKNPLAGFFNSLSCDGVSLIDLENPKNQWFNCNFWDTLGYQSIDCNTKKTFLSKIYFQNHLESFHSKLNEHLKNPDIPFDILIGFISKHGHRVWMQCKGIKLNNNQNASRFLTVYTNITEFKDNKDFLKICNLNAKIGFWKIDLVVNKLIWSSVTKEIHEVDKDYQPELGSAINFYEKGRSRNKIEKLFNNAVTKGESFKTSLAIITVKGNKKIVRSTGIPEFENNMCVRVYGTFQDITKYKQAEKRLMKSLLAYREQNNTLKKFAQVLSHNIRSKSIGISGLLDIYKSQKHDFFEDEILSLLDKSSNELMQTIDSLNEVVEMGLIPKIELKSINISEAVDEAVNKIKNLLKDQLITVENKINANYKVIAFPLYLESIIINLVTNAIKYRAVERNSFLKISASKKNNYIVLSFQDNGIGIDVETHKEHIFGLYKTFHEKGTNSQGLGLFVTKRQVLAMDGKIKIESQLNKGTTIKVYLKNGKD